MVREIIHDPFLLSMKSTLCDENDVNIGLDLLDTLKSNSDRCVGMAANMIGFNKCIICFLNGNEYMLMYNPEIVDYKFPYDAEEGCLSLEGIRKTKRYKKIKVKYKNIDLKERIMTFEGFTAQIIQHEIDHCNGVLI